MKDELVLIQILEKQEIPTLSQRQDIQNLYEYLRNKHVKESIGHVRLGSLSELCYECLTYGFYYGQIEQKRKDRLKKLQEDKKLSPRQKEFIRLFDVLPLSQKLDVIDCIMSYLEENKH